MSSYVMKRPSRKRKIDEKYIKNLEKYINYLHIKLMKINHQYYREINKKVRIYEKSSNVGGLTSF